MKKWVVIALFGITILSLFLWFRREFKVIAAEPISAWTEDHKADCAVVLTGGAGRVKEGFDLLAQRQVHKLIISGVNPRATLRSIFPQWPFYGGLRVEDVILERRSATTFGNAQQTLPLVEALRCRSLILVTSHIHMHRAFKTFSRIFPSEILILRRGVSSGAVPAKFSDLAAETLKSLFYSTWAY